MLCSYRFSCCIFLKAIYLVWSCWCSVSERPKEHRLLCGCVLGVLSISGQVSSFIHKLSYVVRKTCENLGFLSTKRKLSSMGGQKFPQCICQLTNHRDDTAGRAYTTMILQHCYVRKSKNGKKM